MIAPEPWQLYAIGIDQRLDPAGKRFYGISLGPVRSHQMVARQWVADV
jgi:hypothetical protein